MCKYHQTVLVVLSLRLCLDDIHNLAISTIQIAMVALNLTLVVLLSPVLEVALLRVAGVVVALSLQVLPCHVHWEVIICSCIRIRVHATRPG